MGPGHRSEQLRRDGAARLERDDADLIREAVSDHELRANVAADVGDREGAGARRDAGARSWRTAGAIREATAHGLSLHVPHKVTKGTAR